MDNMTQRDDVAEGPCPADPKWGRPTPHPWPAGQVLAHFQKPFSPFVIVGKRGIQCGKGGGATKLGRPAGLTSGPHMPNVRLEHYLTPIKPPCSPWQRV
jgi:hypothetical protein